MENLLKRIAGWGLAVAGLFVVLYLAFVAVTWGWIGFVYFPYACFPDFEGDVWCPFVERVGEEAWW